MSNALHSTKRYDLFELCDFNRNVQKTDRLEKSMRAHGYLIAYPLHCVRNGNGKLKIKAGHHRFVVAQKLGLAVWYVVCEDNATIQELERSTMPWTLADYHDSYCRLEIASYLAVEEYVARTGIGLSQAVSMLAGEGATSANQSTRFKEGRYLLGPPEHSMMMSNLAIGCREAGVKFAVNRNFVGALSRIARLSVFDPKRFLHRVGVNIGMMQPQASLDGYTDLIDRIYNHGSPSQSRIALAFLAREESRQRKASFSLGRKKK